MSFAQPFPRPFNERGIRSYAPAASGVYGISNSLEWIHVGETSDIRGALLAALDSRDSDLHQLGPTGFVFELCDQAARAGRRSRLIAEYNPVRERRRGF